MISLNSLVLIRTPRGAEEGEDEEDDIALVEEEEEEEPEVDDNIKVAVAVLRASDALDLSAAARQLGWPGARLAPRSEVPRLLSYRFAPGGIPPLGHGAGVETLVCSRALLAGEEEEGEGDERDSIAFVAGGGDPALRLVFRGPRALAAAMEAEGAKVVSGLGVERPPLMLPPPGASTSSNGDGDENDDDSASSSAAPGAVYYCSPPPLFVDDAEGVRALADILLPPSNSNSNSTSSSEEVVSLPSATERNEDTQSSGGGGGGGSSSSAGSKKGAGSNRQRWHLLGLDAEWVPESDRGSSGRHPVETLQLATKEAAAVLDVAALARSREGSESIIDLLTRAATAGTGAGENGGGGGGGGGGDSGVRVLFVGHSARQDLVRLARTLAEASAARGEGGGGGGAGAGREGEGGGGGDSDCESPRPSLLRTLPPLPVHSVDLPAIAKWAVSPPGAVVPAGRLPGGHGLANLVRIFLGDRGAGELSKEQQRSDWGRRPLSAEQLRYAAADAHACVAVAERILTELRPELASTRKRAAAHAGGLTELDGGFSRGSGGGRRNKNLLPSRLAPLPPPLAPGPARDARRAAREERRRAEAAAMTMAAGEGRRGTLDDSLFSSSSRSLDRGAARGRRRGGGGGGGGEGPMSPPPPTSSGGGAAAAADADADVEGLLRDFLGLPLPGKGGRGLAVAAALGLLSLPDGGPSWRRSGSGRGRGDDDDDGDGGRERRNQHLSVPRFDRGGVARLRNACVLFVNLDAGGGGGASRYPNEFIRGEAGETRLTWFPSPGQGEMKDGRGFSFFSCQREKEREREKRHRKKKNSPFFFSLSKKKKNKKGESHPLVRRLLSPKIAGGEKHSVLLFCRLRSARLKGGGGNGPYYFLG